MRLSEHFHLREFTRSQTAERLGRRVLAPPPIVAEIERLCRDVLQPIRARLGRAITITSGFRPAWLNSAIGGDPMSAHLHGRAADLVVAGMTAFQASDSIARLAADLPFDQIIHEFGRWTHVSIAAPGTEPRRSLLTATHDGEKVVYIPGIQFRLIRTEVAE